MPIYIAVLNQKGGAGKTATAVNLSGALHKLGHKVLAVDADTQQSLHDWMHQAETPEFPFAVLSMAHAQLHRKLPEVADPAGFDFVVIDCPPGGHGPGNAIDERDKISRSAALVADLVLVPLQPQPTDFLAVRRLKPVLSDLCAVKPDLMVAVVINEKKKGESMSRNAREDAFTLLEDEGINLTILEQEITSRSVISKSVSFGVTIHDHKPKASSDKEATLKASREYVALAKEIKACLKTHSPALARAIA